MSKSRATISWYGFKPPSVRQRGPYVRRPLLITYDHIGALTKGPVIKYLFTLSRRGWDRDLLKILLNKGDSNLEVRGGVAAATKQALQARRGIRRHWIKARVAALAAKPSGVNTHA